MMKPKTRILIVDDEKHYGRMVKINLEEEGHYEVCVEHLGSKSLETAQKFRPNLVLMDIMMRDQAGAKSAHDIHSDESLKDVPIVFLSAAVPKTSSTSPEDLIQGLPYIAKPVAFNDLIDYIELYLRK